jgi:hypothetical protein
VTQNIGISEISNFTGFSTTFPDNPAVNYINGINEGADPVDPLDNFFEMLSFVPGSGNPASLISTGFTVPRGASLRMYSGGGSTTDAGRYSLYLSGNSDESEHVITTEVGSRCSVMINQD